MASFSDKSIHKSPEKTRFNQSPALDNLVDLLLELNIIEKERIAVSHEARSSEQRQNHPLEENEASPIEVDFQEVVDTPETESDVEEINSLNTDLEDKRREDELAEKLWELLEELPLEIKQPLESSSSTTNLLSSEPSNNNPELEAKASPPTETKTSSRLEENAELQSLKIPLSQKELGNELRTKTNSSEIEDQNSIRILLPLVLEMLQVNETEWRESLFQALVPMIDEIIQERSVQNSQAMSTVLAGLIPAAIAEEIRKHPKQVATAIAPEMALAIQEQIRLDRNAISTALASEMGRAIKAQIELERDAMVDALYPVIGSTISKYMVEFVRSINEKLENNLSPETIQRKIRAKMQGVSEEELIFRESLPMKVQAVFLIHKNSGLVMCEVQPSETDRLEADMLAGMLTAIRSFANDCIAREGDVLELSEIEYGDSKIIIESAGYCYIAVVVKGEPTKNFIQEMREAFTFIVQKYSLLIEEYSGDPETIPETVPTLLKGLIKPQSRETTAKQEKSSKTLFSLIIIFLGIVLLPLGFYSYRNWLANRLETRAALALYRTPELSIYNLSPELNDNVLILTGKVPNVYLRAEAEKVVREAIPNREIENEIIAVEIPPNPIAIETEIQRLTNLFNQEDGVNITTVYKAGKVTVTGRTSKSADIRKITLALAEIPGVYSVLSTIQQQAPKIETQLYFSRGSARLKDGDIPTKIASVTRYLNRYPEVSLRIIGFTDEIGSDRANQRLALQRANQVKEALENQGISPDRLQISGTLESPPDINANQPQWLYRTVHFDPYIPAEEK